MSSKDGSVLVVYQGRGSGDLCGIVAAEGVPENNQAVGDQSERNGVLDGVAQSVEFTWFSTPFWHLPWSRRTDAERDSESRRWN